MGSPPTNSVPAVSYLVCLALSWFSPAVLLFSWLTFSYLIWNYLTPVYPLWSYHISFYYYILYTFHLCTQINPPVSAQRLPPFVDYLWYNSLGEGGGVLADQDYILLYCVFICFYIIYGHPPAGAQKSMKQSKWPNVQKQLSVPYYFNYIHNSTSKRQYTETRTWFWIGSTLSPNCELFARKMHDPSEGSM